MTQAPALIARGVQPALNPRTHPHVFQMEVDEHLVGRFDLLRVLGL
jgi:hypothetical protein